MDHFPLIRALIYSLLVMTAALLLSADFSLFQLLSCLVVIFSGLVLANTINNSRVTESPSYFSSVLFTIAASIAVGCPEFPIISLSILYLTIAFSLLLGKQHERDLIVGGIFRLTLLLLIFVFWFPFMVWLVIPVGLMSIFSKHTTKKEMLSFILSFISLSLVWIWVAWITRVDILFLFRQMLDFPALALPEYPFTIQTGTFYIVVVSLLIVSLISWASFSSRMREKSTNAYRMELFGYWMVIALSLMFFVVDVNFSVLAFYSLPLSCVLYMSQFSSKGRNFLITFFFIAVASAFFVSREFHLYFYDIFKQIVQYVL